MPTGVDQNEFFREVTLRLCSNLDLEEALCSCVEYIGAFMPADAISVGRFEENFESYRILARAPPEEGITPDVLVPMPPTVRAAHDTFAEQYHRNELRTVMNL